MKTKKSGETVPFNALAGISDPGDAGEADDVGDEADHPDEDFLVRPGQWTIAMYIVRYSYY